MAEDFVPNDNQLGGIRFMLEKSYGALFWDPGCRKTSTVLYAYKLLRDEGLVNRMLVLSEVNILNDTWPAEIERWSDLDVTYASMVGGGEARRKKAFELDADVYLLNNENVEWFWDTYRKVKPWPFDMLAVDESTKYRNRGTDRFRALRKMLSKFKRRYILTGTPTPKGYENLWAQMFIVDMGESLGVTLGRYRLEHFEPGGFKGKHWELREGEEPRILARLGDRVHRVEKHLDVTIDFQDIQVKLPPKAMTAYRELEEELITQWAGKTLLANNAAVATQKLRQAANGAVYYEDDDLEAAEAGRRAARLWVALHTAKIEALKQLLKHLKGKPLLLAYEFKHDYLMMQKHGLKFPSYTLAKPGKERTALKEAWNRGELPVLCGQIASMSHGLNVQFGGSHLAYYGLTYNLEDYEQFFQRLWRDGQENDVVAYRIGAQGTVDETMMEVLHVRHHDQKMLLGALLRRFGV